MNTDNRLPENPEEYQQWVTSWNSDSSWTPEWGKQLQMPQSKPNPSPTPKQIQTENKILVKAETKLKALQEYVKWLSQYEFAKEKIETLPAQFPELNNFEQTNVEKYTSALNNFIRQKNNNINFAKTKSTDKPPLLPAKFMSEKEVAESNKKTSQKNLGN